MDRAKKIIGGYQERLTQEDVFEKAASQEKRFQLDQLEIDAETDRLLRTLRNPFIPQLPMNPPEEIKKTLPVSSAKQNPSLLLTPKQDKPLPADNGTVPTEEVVLKPQFQISGIVWNTDLPQAIMQGQVVTLGDQIENWTVSGITRQGVEIIYKSTKFLIEP